MLYYPHMPDKKVGKTQKNIGTKFKKARLVAKMTQIEVAKEADITVTYYAMIERGEVNPSVEKLHKLIKVLKIKSFDLSSL